MAVSASGTPWTLRMPAGSAQEWAFTLSSAPTGGYTPPWPVPGGTTWEYVVRPTPTDDTTPLIEVTTTSSSAGVITVTSTSLLSQVLLTVTASATASLDGTYYHTLWMNPSTSGAYAWVTGVLIVAGNPQP